MWLKQLLLRPHFPCTERLLEEHAEKTAPCVSFNHLHEMPQLCGDQGSLGMVAPAQTPSGSDDGCAYVLG